jgi:hypothetical protein
MVESQENSRGQTTTDFAQRAKFDICQLAENMLILHEDLPSIQVAEKLILSMSVDELRQACMAPALKAVITVRSRLKKKEHEQQALPGFERMPLFVLDSKKRRRSILNATCWDIGRYVYRIGGSYQKRKRNDARLKQAKELLKKMRAASKRNRGITVGEVLGLTA